MTTTHNVGLNGGVVPIARGSPSPVRNASTGAEGTFRLHKLKKELVTLSREHVIGHSTLSLINMLDERQV